MGFFVSREKIQFILSVIVGALRALRAVIPEDYWAAGYQVISLGAPKNI